ncbi:glycoside hydrolase family 28 protein [Bacteroides sp. 51]|uniref:glycoside hydrolase family 28 protein n=1 Tax=Bacteroides sp. 51 TaxID=2302938 RepID=UPI0013D3E6A6|nr:glycosyl hydrolase family 28 protein [Bacteroides sp. 51]NDV82148.1 glycoside hydrolase family 28 protein [Bacteroides sp. 51]
MNLSLRHLNICVVALAVLTGCNTPKQSPGDIPSFDWIASDQPIDLSWVQEVGAKTFPASKAFSANAFGAVNDTTVLSTDAIQAAIDSCHNTGGGIVTLQPGYYTTGALFIKKGVNLEIGKGVTLYASTDINHYPEIPTRVAGIEMVWPSAVLNVLDTENAAISGEGTIDCRGKVFWDKYWDMRKEYVKEGLRWIVDYDAKRVRGILVSNSSNVTLKDFTLMRTGFWGVQVLYSNHCTVNGLNINNNIGGHGPSTDGIDIDSSSYILIENCDVDCNDDNICIKAGRDADGLRVNRPTEYVVVRNCIARKGAGLITCGSETSGGIRNILGYNLRAYGTSAALRIKSALNRGGFVENVFMTDVVADSVKYILAADLNWNPSYSYSTLPEQFQGKEIPEHWKVMLTPVEPKEKGYPIFKNVYLSNVKATGGGQFITASGWNDSLRLENFQLYNIDAEVQKAGQVDLTDSFILKEIKLKIADKNQIDFKNNNDLIAEIQYE